MKFEGLGLVVKLFGFWGLCLWIKSMLGVSHFIFIFWKLPILVIKKAFKNQPNSIKRNFSFKSFLGFGVYVYGLVQCWVFSLFF
jgi:hypothetical protein